MLPFPMRWLLYFALWLVPIKLVWELAKDAAVGWTNRQIAAALGLTDPTLSDIFGLVLDWGAPALLAFAAIYLTYQAGASSRAGAQHADAWCERDRAELYILANASVRRDPYAELEGSSISRFRYLEDAINRGMLRPDSSGPVGPQTTVTLESFAEFAQRPQNEAFWPLARRWTRRRRSLGHGYLWAVRQAGLRWRPFGYSRKQRIGIATAAIAVCQDLRREAVAAQEESSRDLLADMRAWEQRQKAPTREEKERFDEEHRLRLMNRAIRQQADWRRRLGARVDSAARDLTDLGYLRERLGGWFANPGSLQHTADTLEEAARRLLRDCKVGSDYIRPEPS